MHMRAKNSFWTLHAWFWTMFCFLLKFLLKNCYKDRFPVQLSFWRIYSTTHTNTSDTSLLTTHTSPCQPPNQVVPALGGGWGVGCGCGASITLVAGHFRPSGSPLAGTPTLGRGPETARRGRPSQRAARARRAAGERQCANYDGFVACGAALLPARCQPRAA